MARLRRNSQGKLIEKFDLPGVLFLAKNLDDQCPVASGCLSVLVLERPLRRILEETGPTPIGGPERYAGRDDAAFIVEDFGDERDQDSPKSNRWNTSEPPAIWNVPTYWDFPSRPTLNPVP